MMTVNQSHILDAKAKHYSYCPSFKSATTTWFNILIRLTNDSETYIGKARKELNRKWALIPAHLLYLGAINPGRKEWSEYISSLNNYHNLTGFMVVRHPFD